MMPHQDQLLYARILTVLVKVSMAALALSWLIYAFFEETLQIPSTQIARIWSQPASLKTETPVLTFSLDHAPMISVMLISAVSLICVSALCLFYIKAKKIRFATLTGIQVLIIAVAMSGIANELFRH